MNEDFLQYVWGQRLYASEIQQTTDGRQVEVLNPGRKNYDAGPDFFNAQIRIDGVTWAGNIEVHTSSDDWFRHGHDKDKAYDNVILHVVATSGKAPVVTSSGCVVPELVLRYPKSLLEHVDELLSNSRTLPVRCAPFIPNIPSIIRSSWLDALLYERVQVKSERIANFMELARGDKDQAFFCLLARTMGGRVNSEPMEMLARSTPIKVLLKHPSVVQTEALLLGQAGLLDACAEADDYVALLRREYLLLKAKFDLHPIDASLWKYLRLRPANFPDVRLVQLAALLRAIPGNFEGAFGASPIPKLLKSLAQSPSEYWETHYKLGHVSAKAFGKRIGKSTCNLLVVNAVAPFLMHCARSAGDEERQEHAVEMLRGLDVEQNSKLSLWSEVGIEARDEGEAQALLQLTNAYCERSRCLHCRFGHAVVSRKS